MADNLRMVEQGTSFYDSVSGQNETQTITIDADGGTYTVTFDGQTTTAIPEAAAASAVQSALEALSTIGTGNVSVTGSAGGPYTVEFVGDLARTPLPAMTTTATSLTGGAGTAVVATTKEGINGLNLSWGTGSGAQREIVAMPAAARSARLLKEIADGNIEETGTAVTTKPAEPYGLNWVKLSRRLAVEPEDGDTLTYDADTDRWVPEEGN